MLLLLLQVTPAQLLLQGNESGEELHELNTRSGSPLMLALKLSRASLSMVSSSSMDNVHRNGHETMRNRKNRGDVEVPGKTEPAMI